MAAPATDLALPMHLRGRLARPFGPVVQTGELVDAVGGRPVAAVGDVVALTCLQVGITPRLVVCDLKTQRGGQDPGYARTLGSWGDTQVSVDNPAGHVARQAWIAVGEAVARPGTTCIVVHGEEDLLGLPVLCEAPEDWVMLYGMPGAGVVVTDVGALREEARQIVAQMLPARLPS